MIVGFGKCDKCGKTQFIHHTNSGRICGECKRKYGICGAFSGGESTLEKLKRLLKDMRKNG